MTNLRAQPNGSMTKAERDELAKLVRRREKLAKADADQRGAELLADFERQMAAIYQPDDDPVWQEARRAVQEVVNEARAKISERCRELGIWERSAPDIGAHWYGRGENATAERRAELRKVATTRIAAMTKAAKTEIERQSIEVQTQLVAGGLESVEAREFLASMPTAEALMPVPPTLAEIEAGT
jgi:hypothetical protein